MRISAPLNSEPIPGLQQIEVATFFQLPSFHIIGLPGPEVAEAKERVRAAIDASELEFPKRRVVLNLSPASIRKTGTGLDLAMALGVLCADIQSDLNLGAWGELGLDGSVKPAGQITRSVYAAWRNQLTHLFVSKKEHIPAIEAMECVRLGILNNSELFTGFHENPPIIVPVRSLREAWTNISEYRPENTKTQPEPIQPRDLQKPPTREVSDAQLERLSQNLLPLTPALERILSVSIAGHHHILLLGPRGAGKSHALEWLIALQQPSSASDQLQQRLMRELNTLQVNGDHVRRISSQVKPSALLGGATSLMIRPGEVSLAHGGLLIADELPEWARDSREALREPLERGKVTLTRTQGSLELPARFLFAANGNFCPCGGWPRQLPQPSEWKNHSQKLTLCQCTQSSRKNYLAKLSGPLLDRIDLVSTVTPPPVLLQNSNTHLAQLRKLQKRLNKTQESLLKSWGKLPGLLSGTETESIIQSLTVQALTVSGNSGCSLRSRHKTARLALTLAAWDGMKEPSSAHWLEASFYRAEPILKLE